MSRDPECPDCSNDEKQIEESRSRWSHLDVNIVLHKPPFFDARVSADKLLDPNEHDSQCVNPACSEGQDEIEDVLKKINKDLKYTARTGDWTDIETADIERLEQLSEGALDIVDEQSIEWPNDKAKNDWKYVEDKIDEFGENFDTAAEYTTFLHSQRGIPNPGLEKMPQTASVLENLNELEDKINEREEILDEETTITEDESEEDEQQERDDRIQELEEKLQDEQDKKQELRDELQKERDEKQEQREKNQELEDKLQEQRDENLDLRKENLDMKEKIQNLGEQSQEQGTATESERDAKEANTTERARDGAEKDAVGGGGTADSEEQAQPTLSVTADVDTNLGISHPDDGVAVALDTGGSPDNQTTIHVSDQADAIDYADMPDELGVPLAGDSEIQVDTGPDDSITTMLTGSGSPSFGTTTGDQIQVTSGKHEIPLRIDPDEDQEHDQNRDQDEEPATESDPERYGSRDTGQATGDDGMAVSPQTNGHDNPQDYLPPGDGRPIDDDERDSDRGTDNTRDRS